MASSNKTTTCPSCFKTDPEELASCVNKELGMCPKPVRLPEAKVVEVVCAAPCGGPCGKHMAIPIGAVMKRRHLTNLGQCHFDVCRARVVEAAAPEQAAPALPPITDTTETKPTVNGTEQTNSEPDASDASA